jgi:mRNA-degrading endonuclease RelE of RelBE toxin-antitoxin system
MAWRSRLTKKAEKQAAKLPKTRRELLFQLLREVELSGPVRGNWPNYSKLGEGRHHCHLKKGRPTYVAVWVEREDEIRLVEVIYAGTHENAPY